MKTFIVVILIIIFTTKTDVEPSKFSGPINSSLLDKNIKIDTSITDADIIKIMWECKLIKSEIELLDKQIEMESYYKKHPYRIVKDMKNDK